jgi:hypothetical protein
MSKCKPDSAASDLVDQLSSKGVIFAEETKRDLVKDEKNRFAVIKIPYHLLSSDKDVQVAFQDLLTVRSEEKNPPQNI